MERWHDNWPILGFEHLDDAERDSNPDYVIRRTERDAIIDMLGNLTLLTQSLNSSVSNGPFSVKMPAVRSHSSLALNRELNAHEDWNEETIAIRGKALFATAQKIWTAPLKQEASQPEAKRDSNPLPPEGTMCKFSYGGDQYEGQIKNGLMIVEGHETPFGSFSAASKAITQTNRNGWNDWYLKDSAGIWILANEWRQQL